MAVSFSCPHCGARTEVDQQYAGTSGPCATCGKTITIPGGGTAAGGMSVAVIIAIVAAVLLVGLCVIGILVAMLLPAVQAAREAARRAQCGNNLRQISFALLEYETQYETFPPAYIAADDGTPMHSWRVLILPQLGEQMLYEQYDFSQPWDSPANLALVDRMPAVYACPSDAQTASQETSYMVIVGPDTLFPGTEAVGLIDCADGASNTLCVVESANSSTTWTEPTDLDAQQMMFLIGSGGDQEIGSYHSNGANAAFADGSVRLLDDTMTPEELEALSTCAGGEQVFAKMLYQPQALAPCCCKLPNASALSTLRIRVR